MKALIVVDMQNDFIDGALGTKEAQSIVDGVVERIAKSKDELILFTLDTHQDDYLETTEGKKLPVVHCIEGSPGWEINASILDAWKQNTDTIKAADTNTMVNNTFLKPVFGSTDLVDYLVSRADDIDEVEIIGVCTDICVVSNAIMIKNTLPDMPIVVNSALCAGVTTQSHTEALNTMKMCHIDVV